MVGFDSLIICVDQLSSIRSACIVYTRIASVNLCHWKWFIRTSSRSANFFSLIFSLSYALYQPWNYSSCDDVRTLFIYQWNKLFFDVMPTEQQWLMFLSTESTAGLFFHFLFHFQLNSIRKLVSSIQIQLIQPRTMFVFIFGGFILHISVCVDSRCCFE